MVKGRFLAFAAIALVLLFVGVFSASVSQGFTLVGESVVIGEVTSASCSVRTDHLEELDLGSISKDGEFYSCTTSETGKYVPLVSGVQCEFFAVVGEFHNAFDCPRDVDDSDDVRDDCDVLKRRLSARGATDEYRYVVDAGRSLFIDPAQIFGPREMTAKYPSYGLLVETPDNFKFPQTLNCDVSSFRGSAYHTINASSRLVVTPGNPLNVVTRLTSVVSSRLVSLDDVAGGETIYITRPNYYKTVSRADDGFLYVDVGSDEIFDSRIECLPLAFGCSADAKVIPLTEQEVTESGLGAVVSAYAPVMGSPGVECRYTVVDGVVSVTDDCRLVPESCPDSKPLYDSVSGECVSQVAEKEPFFRGDNALLIAMGVIVLLFLVVIVLIVRNQRQMLRVSGGGQ